MLFVHAPGGKASKPPMRREEIIAAFPDVTFPSGSFDNVDLSHMDLHPVPFLKPPAEAAGDGMKWGLGVPVKRSGKWVRTFARIPASS